MWLVELFLGAGPRRRGGAGELSPSHSSHSVGDEFHCPRKPAVFSPRNHVRCFAAIRRPPAGYWIWILGLQEQLAIVTQVSRKPGHQGRCPSDTHSKPQTYVTATVRALLQERGRSTHGRHAAASPWCPVPASPDKAVYLSRDLSQQNRMFDWCLNGADKLRRSGIFRQSRAVPAVGSLWLPEFVFPWSVSLFSPPSAPRRPGRISCK